MAEVGSAPGVTPEAMAAAIEAALPKAATAMPQPEKTGAAVGAGVDYARGDHQHPRLTSITYATLAADGTATVAFSRTFVNKPGLNLTETDATSASQPLVLRGLTWTMTGGLYTGVTISGSRAQMLPTIGQLSITSLLTGVIGGVNTIATALTGYNVFGGSAAGATVSVIAIARSDVSST